MNKRIHKYNFDPSISGGHIQRFIWGKGSVILSAQFQDGSIVFWILEDIEAEQEQRTYIAYETGAKIDIDTHLYIATVQIPPGRYDNAVYYGLYVLHIFQIPNSKFQIPNSKF